MTAANGRRDVDALKFKASEPAVLLIPPEVQAMIVAAKAGERSALPALKQALADHPELIDRLGNLAAYVERGLVALLAGASLAVAESVTAHLAKMRQELGEATASPLERLLIQRVALWWLACHTAEVERGELLQRGAGEMLKAADQRVGRAHARFLTATKALATVRELVVPVASGATSLPASRGLGAARSRPHQRSATAIG
jgi:hypothetical protein